MSVTNGLRVKVLTSSSNTKITEALERSYNSWIESIEAEGHDVEVYQALQSECAVNSVPHVTITILYKLI